MKNIKRNLAIFLLTAMMTAMLAACSNTGNGSVSVETQAEVTEAAETAEEIQGETERSQAKDSLPDNLNFDGQTVRVLGRDDNASLTYEIYAAENSGDVVEDAIYLRNIAVEERLNIVIEPQYVSQNIHGGDVINGKVRTAVLSGTDDYDIVANHMSQTTPLILEGCFINLNNLDYLDFDQPWWSESFKDKITVNGKLYFAVGDIALTMLKAMYSTFINLDLFEANFTGESIYDVVLAGDWTIAKMAEYCKVMYNDLNGDGTADKNDQYGYVVNQGGIHCDAMMGATNVHIIDSSKPVPEFILDTQRTYDFVDTYRGLLFNDNGAFVTTDGDGDYYKYFKNGTSLFTTMMLSHVEDLRDMEPDYGIIPAPKLNEDQPEYTGWTHNGFSAFTIIQTCKYTDTAACVLEAMCAESYRTVTEAFFDVALKLKYARDDVSSKMLDLIRDSIVFDFGMVYSQALESVMQMFRDVAKTADFNTASRIAAKLKVSQAKLDNLLATYETLQ